ncbi:MAG TPA: S41 family peptidase, partial [Candidatus Saccharimonadales bacterium]|nr:S41 family peptidase [Candidatus Saccharimonadales bacterium]
LLVSIIVVALLAGGALFMSGYSIGRQAAVEPGTPVSEDEAFRPFWDTYHTINDRYAGGDVDRDVLIQGAIKGMIEALGDPYSSYLTSEEYRSTLQGISGEFEGIGAEIATEAPDGTQGCATLGPECRLVIVAPLEGSPAKEADLRSGDLVLAADGVSLDGLTVDEARDRIRGPKGTVVTLTVQRDDDEPFALEITRDIIEQEEVESRDLADGSVGYVRLNGFSDRGADELQRALEAHIEAGRTDLILDLRGNPGGYVTAARDVASQFIASGPVFWEQDADGTQTATDALPGGVATDPSIRVVCLIDGGSASASEIVAGALQDTGRATLVGETSFGKGTVQQWQELTGEGGAFRLTIARWLTPQKRWIHDDGIEPDVAVTLPDEIPADADPILDRALDVLAGEGSAGAGIAPAWRLAA